MQRLTGVRFSTAGASVCEAASVVCTQTQHHGEGTMSMQHPQTHEHNLLSAFRESH
jgi:hypothetical protein